MFIICPNHLVVRTGKVMVFLHLVDDGDCDVDDDQLNLPALSLGVRFFLLNNIPGYDQFNK